MPRAVPLLSLLVATALTPGRSLAVEPAVPAPRALHLAFVTLDGSALVPFGGWSDHASAGTGSYPSGTPQFNAGGGGSLAVGWSPGRSRWFSVGLEGSFDSLGTSSWEDFARRRGMPLTASASLWSVAASGTVALPDRTSTFGVELHGALGVLVASGGEQQGGGVDRSYTFLRSTMFGRVGARFVARLVDRVDTFVGLDLLAAPGGVRHRASSAAPGGGVRTESAQTISALEPTLGVRMWFDPL